MKLTKTSAQASLAMAFLADRDDTRPTQARQVAEHLGIPTDSALKVLQSLVRHQLLRSQLGRRGGYQMLRPADSVTLLQIIEAIDGPIAVDLPLNPSEDALARPVGVLRDACARSAEHLRGELSQLTVADLTVAKAPPVSLAAAS